MKKQFIVVGEDLLGNIVWGVAPTLKEAGAYVALNSYSISKPTWTYIYFGNDKPTVVGLGKIEFTDSNGKIALIGKFDLATLLNMD
jgi:hypothetical protein